MDYAVTDVLRGECGAPGPERPDVAQPALFAAEVALARLWQAHGVRPSAVVGHSQGEVAAAHIAGMLSLEDAARIAAVRGRLLAGRTGPGGMLAVQCPPGFAHPDLDRWDGALSVAAYNSPHTVVVSGDTAALDELAALCSTQGMSTTRVPVGFAAHTPAIEALRGELLDLLAGMGVRPFEATGRPFDPRYHEAVEVVAAGGEHAAGAVVEELQRGYLIGDAVLRPARVRVARES